ncbi:hypothetical protein H0H81_002318 [Sphagnurus paluster]|uniref:Crinkler effector protein N-terminal domain-containing protein n=1 Tax=Sphagnurus paluster TaxID=117069 RepID=A0A9P7GN07_9AGAR|nr:hypothetical protein H0H81_002318 [Sphagnurus paluster]
MDNMSVTNFKDSIKASQSDTLAGIHAHDLDLFNVAIPIESDTQGFEDLFDSLRIDEPRPMVGKLSRYFRDLNDDHIHVLVKLSIPSPSRDSITEGEVKTLRSRFLEARPKEPPSNAGVASSFQKDQENSEKLIPCNRPYSAAATVPLTLLHPVFGQFKDDCETLMPTREDNMLTLVLQGAMSDFYANEADRNDAVLDALETVGIMLKQSKIDGSDFKTDGDAVVGLHRFAIAVFNNEVTSSGADPYLQAIIYYLESTRNCAEATPHSVLPCLLMLVFELPFITSSRPSRNVLFPHPTHFTALDGSKKVFDYVSQVDPDKLLFFGELLEGGDDICIKFTHSYSKEAHEFCAALNIAPRLRGFDKIPGGWYMVVMDRIDEEYYSYNNFRRSSNFNAEYTSPLHDAIWRGLKSFHDGGYVHGDVRGVNLMVAKSGEARFRLIDFDWAGEVDKALYPMNVNTEGLWRPADAYDNNPITIQHDEQMMEFIIGKASVANAQKVADIDKEACKERENLAGPKHNNKLCIRAVISVFGEVENEGETASVIYALHGASWVARCDIRVDTQTEEKPVALIYKATMTQSTGEDAKDDAARFLTVAKCVTALWQGADDPDPNVDALGRNGIFNWICTIPPHTKINLALQWEVLSAG